MKKNLVPAFVSLLTLSALVACGGTNGSETGPASNIKYEKMYEHNNAGLVALVDGTDTSGATWDPVTATNEVERVLSGRNGEGVDVVLSNNDGMALGIVKSETFKKAGIPIFGVDALGDALTAIKAGTMTGTVKNDSYTQAHVALQLFKNLDEKKPVETDICTGTKIEGAYDKFETDTKAIRVHHQKITKENVDDFKAPEVVKENILGETVNPTKKLFALTYNNSDPNMSGLWKSGFNDFGKKYGYQIKWTDGQNDDEKAKQALDQAVKSKEYDGYLINVVNQSNGKSYLDLVTDNKPVIFYNRELTKGNGIDTELMQSRENVYYVGIESAEGGKIQGEMAAEWFNANYKTNAKIDRNGDGIIGAIVVRGEKGHSDAEARTEWSPKIMDEKLAIK